MSRANRYAGDVRERAVRMVLDQKHEYPSEWAAMTSIASKIGCKPETLRRWVRQAETDTGSRAGLRTEERSRMKDLEREVKELRRANDILRSASTFFAAELDRHGK